jgi:hypothetical protein
MSPTQFQKPESVKEKLTEKEIAWMSESVNQRTLWSTIILVAGGLLLAAPLIMGSNSTLLFASLFLILIGVLMKRGVKQIKDAISSGTKYVARFKCKKKWMRFPKGSSRFDSKSSYIITDDGRNVKLKIASSGNSNAAFYEQLEENDVLVVHAIDEWINLWIDVQIEKANTTK